jgi:hypothetical protein
MQVLAFDKGILELFILVLYDTGEDTGRSLLLAVHRTHTAITPENDTHVKSHTWPFEPKMCTTLLEPVVATHVPCGCHENTMGPWP